VCEVWRGGAVMAVRYGEARPPRACARKARRVVVKEPGKMRGKKGSEGTVCARTKNAMANADPARQHGASSCACAK